MVDEQLDTLFETLSRLEKQRRFLEFEFQNLTLADTGPKTLRRGQKEIRKETRQLDSEIARVKGQIREIQNERREQAKSELQGLASDTQEKLEDVWDQT
jgi:gas vesicle protein